MEKPLNVFSRAELLVALFLFIFALPWNSNAGTHTITFVCCEYNPSQLEASVGDTIIWQGAFEEHPLTSTTIPGGAAAFSNNTGTSFSYVIQIPGTYNYRCNFHFPTMAGSFDAALTSADDKQHPLPTAFQLYPNFPNPFNPVTKIQFSVPSAEVVTLKVFDLLGNEVVTLVNERKSPGSYIVQFDGKGLASGIYLYRLEGKDFSDTKKLLLLK